MKITVELLYPEFNNLYGDGGNALYLEKKLTASGCECEFIKTDLFSEPEFAKDGGDILLIGPCQERHQKLQLTKLAEYKNALWDYIESGKTVLATGNAFELFGSYIESPKGEKTEALGFFPYYAKQFSRLRYNDCSVGDFEGMKIVGFKNLLSHSYGELPHPFLTMEKGAGMNPESKTEGVHYKNLFATYHTGPILPLNPQFTEYFIKLVYPDFTPAPLEFEQEAYSHRLAELTK